MPKIIKNVREQLLQEAKRQIAERGYADTTIRSVAGACDLSVGTVYNYFKSKEMLIATFLFDEWKVHLHEMQNLTPDEPRTLLRGIFDSLRKFAKNNKKLFSDKDAAKLISQSGSEYHRMLRGQIAAFIFPLCQMKQSGNPQFTAEFISESLISWSMENTDFDSLYSVLEKLF